MIKGSEAYVDVLKRAFLPPARWYGPYESFDPRFGNLVYRAKSYPSKPGHPEVARELARLMSERVRQHPAILRAHRVIGIPTDPPKHPYNLPEFLAEQIADAVGGRFDSNLVRKVRQTPPVKDLPNEEKVEALRYAYEATEQVGGETIVVVDDLLYSGTTLTTVANVLRMAGAEGVIGLVATKTVRGERGGPE